MKQTNKLIYYCIYCRLCELCHSNLISQEYFQQILQIVKEQYPCDSVWEL